jgi:hypothetical protein
MLVGQLVAEFTDGIGLQRKEKGLIYGLAYLLSVPFALIPAWLSWRYAFSRPRQLAITCPECQWSGVIRLTQGKIVVSTTPAPVSHSVQFDGVPSLDDPVKKRLERLERRKRRQTQRQPEESEPNPDLNFDD